MTAVVEPLPGGCLCGAVAFEITAAITSMANCHCSMCRKQHGTAFSTYCRVPASALRIARGADSVRTYRSSAAAARQFCGDCGTKLTFVAHDDPASVWVAAGALDGDPGLKPACHIFVASKAPWYTISDSLPQHAAHLPLPG